MIGALFVATVLFMQAQPAATPPESAATTAGKTVSPLVVRPMTPGDKRRALDPKEVVCQEELPPGTRFPIRVCAHRSEFTERTQISQEVLRDWQRAPIAGH